MSTLVLDQNVPVFPVKETPSELRQLTSRQIADTYYGGKAMDESKGYKIYTDDPALSGDIKDLTVYKSRHSKKIGNMDVVLFASKNGAFLLQRYMEALPQSNELILFIETDIGNLKNNVVRAKAGAALTKPGSGEFAEILNFTREYQGIIPQEELRELINKGIYKNKTDIVNWLISIKDTVVREFFNFFTKGILTQAEDFFRALSNDISKFKIEETGWNPNPKEGQYDPTFIPQILSDKIKKYYQHEAEGGAYANLEGQKKVTAEIVDRLFGKIDGIRANLTVPLSNAGKFLPNFVLEKFSQVFDWFFKQLDQLRKFLGDPVTGLLGIAYQGVQTANAFLCGIYNSLVDVIAGIFSLIEFIFKAVAAMQNIGENKIIYGEMLLELMEDFIEGVMSFDYVEFFKQSIAFQINTIKGVINKATSLTLSQVAYYYGYITGIIIDIVVEALLTGGTATVAKLAKSVESFILNPLEKISQAIVKSVNFTKDLLTRAVEFFSLLIREFKKGVKNIFQKLEKLLNEIFGFGDEVADHASTPAERRVKERQKAKASEKELAALSNRLKKHLKILEKMADEALLWNTKKRPKACAFLEGKGKSIFNYSFKQKLPAGKFPKDLHPLVSDWVEDMWKLHKEGKIKLPEHHGKCAEVLNISDWLKSIDPKGKMTIEEARDLFDGVVSHAKEIGDVKQKGTVIAKHQDYKKACNSCLDILHHFNIKEYKINKL
ncbi:YwqJ-related putative deaminase [uncultured Elizabethkingia sp.]|uniref:YwqJ-related putative deaminase n=1 Tax=uncultured Elizabethkingia sp. TaxID=432638 RepID=UPI002595AA75|nr:YwqJ-related putative deaminase [uncultured Elizabethkingia sp.]